MRAFLLLLLATACGAVTSGSEPADAGLADASAVPDAGPGEIEVAIHDESGGPVVDALAILTGADGRRLGEARSGADGKLRLVVDRGDILHVGYVEGSQAFLVYRLITVVDVAPGDQLRLGPGRGSNPVLGRAGFVTIVPSGDNVPAGATRFSLNLGCAVVELADLTPVSREIPRSCLGASGGLTVIAEARDEAGTLLARALHHDVELVDGGTIQMPAWQLPDPPIPVGVEAGDGTHFFSYSLHAHGLRYERGNFPAASGERLAYSLPVTRGYADGFRLSMSVNREGDAEHAFSRLLLERKGSMASLEAGLRLEVRDRVPRLAQASYQSGALRWTLGGTAGEQAGLARSEALDFFLGWGRSDGEGQWTVLAPAGTPSPLSFALYELVDFAPPSTQPVYGSMRITDVGGRDGDYAFFKTAFGPFGTDSGGQEDLADLDLLAGSIDLL